MKRLFVVLGIAVVAMGAPASAIACFECGSYETWVECHDCCMGYMGECESEGGGEECAFVWAECSEGCNELPS